MKTFLVLIPYFLCSLWLTFRVGHNLHRHGRPWIFHLLQEQVLTDKINNMLLLGYRLVNIGYIVLTLMIGQIPGDTLVSILVFYSHKLSLIILILAWLHAQNIFLLVLFSNLKTKFKWQH